MIYNIFLYLGIQKHIHMYVFLFTPILHVYSIDLKNIVYAKIMWVSTSISWTKLWSKCSCHKMKWKQKGKSKKNVEQATGQVCYRF